MLHRDSEVALTMRRMSRRTFLAGVATLAAPAVAIAQGGDVDVVVVGAGAAGIAAARRLGAAGRRCVIVEASDRVGGRGFTESRTFGVPYDRGAHWLHMPDLNPVAKLARGTGFDVYPAPPGQKVRIGPRFAREAEMEIYLAAIVRAKRAIEEAAQEEKDTPASRALPRDLGDWRATVEFALGPFDCGKNLDEISAKDFSRSAERDIDAFCRQGFGALLAKLAEGLTIRLSTPAVRIATWRGVSYVETTKGTLQARAVIVTASTNVLAAGKIKFEPALPKGHLDAMAKLTLGSYDRVALELPGNPLGLAADDLVFEKSNDARTAGLLANVSGTPLCYVDIAGKFGKGLAAQGDAAMAAFAVDWLAGLFGADVKKAVKRTHVTNWAKEPWVLGSFSAAPPGAQGARRTLTEAVRERVFLAGEAVHDTLWGTVGGAWESGERAADAALKRIGGPVRRR